MQEDNREENIHYFDENNEEEEVNLNQDLNTSRYDTQLEEALGLHEDDDNEYFLYEGDDSNQEPPATYDEQLRSVLHDTDGVETYSLDERHSGSAAETFNDDISPKIAVSGHSTPLSFNLTSNSNSGLMDTSSRYSRFFPHATLSRLRSFVPQPVDRSILPAATAIELSGSPRDSASSPTNLMNSSDERVKRQLFHEAFRWSSLKDLGQHIFVKKAATMLGSSFGEPTVLAVNGRICIGTDRGYALVFNLKQELVCICKGEITSAVTGPVTAVALSRDHTFVAVGYGRGYINLFEISRPHTPARIVAPTTPTAVASGRKEGHIEGVTITGLEFIGSRHTTIVSIDHTGLAFYHSLGKILFVEATDTLRILGKYSDFPFAVQNNGVSKDNEAGTTHSTVRKGNVVLAMASLPIGPVPHSIENHSVIALLTSSKLVVVGLKPAPRTWYRKHRGNVDELPTESSRWRGCLAWLPSMDTTCIAADGSITSNTRDEKNASRTQPTLAYSWDRTVFLLQVMEKKVQKKSDGSKDTAATDIEILDFKELAQWSTNEDYLALQWYNAYLLVACTATRIEVWDVRQPSRVESVQTPILSLSPLHAQKNIDYGCIAHGIRIYKGKLFHLCQHEVRVGVLLSWADRILSSVEEGDFLAAIEIAKTYYTFNAPGNRLGLPVDEVALKALVGKRLRDLMLASARYIFSEDRLTDFTHVTPENRGVDRTSLFENMVNTCLDACIALNDFEFIFEDLFDFYQNSGITSIFLRELEPYILEGTVRSIPPRITQKLIAMHENDGAFDHAERVIWHIDPECLDVDQALSLCRKQKLYDALIYVYTTSLKDYLTPLVELMELIPPILQNRHQTYSSSNSDFVDHEMEASVINAYKIFSYLSDTLTGLVYPNQHPMPLSDRTQAKKDIYSFLFFGQSHSYTWPAGETGKLIVNSGSDPAYPYVRLLLQFDAEALLHTLDMAFEDEYFNDETEFISRLVIVKILIEVLTSSKMSPNVNMMINIFIARNVPKYPQSIYTYMTPSCLQTVLLSLAEEDDASTREDRQLAAEYLISIYSPHDHEEVMELFRQAGFYRILRTWYRTDQKWTSLICTYIEDPDIDPAQIFESLDEVLASMKQATKEPVSTETFDVILSVLPRLLETEVTETAIFIDKHLQNLHERVLSEIPSPHKQFIYLRCLLEPNALPEETFWYNTSIRQRPPSLDLPGSLREQYLKLLCQYDAKGVISCLSHFPDDFLDVSRAISICDDNDIHDAVVWMLDSRGDTKEAFKKLKASTMTLASRLGECLTSEREKPENYMLSQSLLDKLKGLGDIGLRICVDRSAISSSAAVEDFWFELLATQVDAAQTVSYFHHTVNNAQVQPHDEEALALLRSLVQSTFTSLISIGSSSTISFPRLFKRLVESVSESTSNHSSYSEFRVILTSMMDSYRGEGDLLSITDHLVKRDLFEATEQLARSRLRGSRAREKMCSGCRKSVSESAKDLIDQDWAVQRFSGLVFHQKCLPATFA